MLGSVVLITDGVGAMKQQYAFNSWGERVDNTDWQSVLPGSNFIPVSQQFTTHSFTGQDALDAVGLINYGGRIYDPRLGRFIQADPVVQDGEDLQAYNRYAYVRNNPLTLTDPSGFSFLGHLRHSISNAISHAWSSAWKAAKPYVGMIVSAVAIAYGCYVCAAAFNSAWTMANGGSLTQGLIAGVSTYAMQFMPGGGNFAQMGFGQIAKETLISGAAGSVMSVVQGGKFGNGFASAGIGYLAGGWGVNNANAAGQFALAVVVGGTVSELTGGKFVNGAMSAAAGWAANAAAGKVREMMDNWGDVVVTAGPGGSAVGGQLAPDQYTTDPAITEKMVDALNAAPQDPGTLENTTRLLRNEDGSLQVDDVVVQGKMNRSTGVITSHIRNGDNVVAFGHDHGALADPGLGPKDYLATQQTGKPSYVQTTNQDIYVIERTTEGSKSYNARSRLVYQHQ